MEKVTYVPGVCNIGPQERKLRSMVGWIGTTVTIVLLAYFHMAHVAKWLNFLIFLPAMAGSMGLLQYYSHFCVNFGMRGLFNVDKEAFQTETVENVEFRAKDKQKALQIIFTGLAISIALTVAAYLL